MSVDAGSEFVVYTHSIDGLVFYVGHGRDGRQHQTNDEARSQWWQGVVNFRNDQVEVREVARTNARGEARVIEERLIRDRRPSANRLIVGRESRQHRWLGWVPPGVI